MSDKTCPVCGSSELVLNKEIKTLKQPYGGLRNIELKSYFCSVCEAEGDLFNENDDLVLHVLEEMKSDSIKNILDDFQRNNISLSAMERALSLPMRTLNKWKNGNISPSSSGTTLLKYIRTFPWLLEVAENNFDYAIAQKIHLSSAMQKFINSMDFNSDDFAESGVVTTSKSMFLYMHLDKSSSSDSLGKSSSWVTTDMDKSLNEVV